MTFGREKRLLIGFLALLAPIPLPFNQVLEWPALFLYTFSVIFYLQRADRGQRSALPNWALNLLGLFYLPVFLTDLRMSFFRNSPVKALLHLILFLVVVKLYSLRREKDKWQLLTAIFFIFIGAMATSSHVTVALYLIAFLVAGLFTLGGLALLHVRASFGEGRSEPAGAAAADAAPAIATRALPIKRQLALGTAVILMLAVPLFAAMPRIREPFILGRGSGLAGMARTTGFSDSVDLSLTSTIRTNRNVALRVQYDGGVGNPAILRFRGATYDRYEGGNWFRLPQHTEVLRSPRRHYFSLVEGEPASRATLYLEPLGSASLILPVETLAVELPALSSLGLDPGGAVLLPGVPRRETLRYEVELAPQPRFAARLDADPESELAALDRTGLTPRMEALAAELMGEGTPGERIDRLEQALLTGYAYTLDFVGRSGERPLEDFLFVYRSGHCEYFASAMVLLLRSQGIPARFVTGFLGAERNPIEDYFIVRQQNAHAWVEAYTPKRGWRIYDPTPPEGRPAIAQPSFSLLMSQLYDYVTFRWDRYVLSYGAADQQSFFQRLRERLAGLWERLEQLVHDEPETAAADPAAVADGDGAGVAAPTGVGAGVWQLTAAALLLAAVAGWLVWRRRSVDGETAYRRLRRLLASAGAEPGAARPPLAVARLAAERFPSAAAAAERVVALYLRESFAGRALTAAERAELLTALRAAAAGVRADRRRRRPLRHTAPAPV